VEAVAIQTLLLRTNPVIISDLTYLEAASEATDIVGGKEVPARLREVAAALAEGLRPLELPLEQIGSLLRELNL